MSRHSGSLLLVDRSRTKLSSRQLIALRAALGLTQACNFRAIHLLGKRKGQAESARPSILRHAEGHTTLRVRTTDA